MIDDKDAYENPTQWLAENYLENPQESERLCTTVGMVPNNATALLDCGAGNGAFLSILTQARPNMRLEGLERSDAARQASPTDVSVRSGSIDALPYKDMSWEVVSCLEVLEHLPHATYTKALREIARVSRNYVLISVPYKEHRARLQCPECNCQFSPYRHLRRFNRQALLDLFPGFQLEHIRYAYASDSWISLARRLLLWFKPAGWVPNACCPQCGYSAPTEQQMTHRSSLRPLKRLLGRRNRYWIVVLYRRQLERQP